MPTPTNKGLFSPQYFGSVYYYAKLAGCTEAVVDSSLRYDKRFKSVHRCTVADTRGPLTITVPVSRPEHQSVRQWRQMTVSSHGQWWSDHRVTLESGYGRTPYFEFYIDRFLPWLSDTNMSVIDYDCTLDAVIRRTLGLQTEVVYDITEVDAEAYADWRDNRFTGVADVPYYQVRADRLGFLPGLSILDLLFNMGPESVLVLQRMLQQ